MSLDVEEYRSLVNQVMRDAKAGAHDGNHVFPNEGTANARIVIDTMLDNAETHVDAYAEKLGRDVYDPDHIKRFLASVPSGTVCALVDSPTALEDGNSALSELHELVKSGRIEVYETDPQYRCSHICVVDSRYVRFEQDHSHRRAGVSFSKESAVTSEAIALFGVVRAHVRRRLFPS
jgi:hypothetical protein